MKIFLISPVRKADHCTKAMIAAYVKSFERMGHQVHWPARDTDQDDPTGGYQICRTNFREMLAADEVHIWYDENSGGSKFDMGGVFMLVRMLGLKKKIVIPNLKEAEELDEKDKSFLKVMKVLTD